MLEFQMTLEKILVEQYFGTQVTLAQALRFGHSILP